MSILPEWAPGLHPLIIHFPIVLLISAALLDVAGILMKKEKLMRPAASVLFLLGTGALLAAYVSGQQAGDTAIIPPEAQIALSSHADLALYSLWFFGAYSLMRAFLLWKKPKEKLVFALALSFVGLAGIGILFRTAERGAELVFRHGIGVVAATDARNMLLQQQLEAETLSHNGIVELANGSWQWNPEKHAEIILNRQFTFWKGNNAELNAFTENDSLNGSFLVLNPENTSSLFTAGKPVESVQMDTQLNLDGFSGTFMLIHHLQDAQNYDFLSLENDTMKLGRVKNGTYKIADQAVLEFKGWIDLSVVGEGRHFRGYLNQKMITHGHDAPLPAGTTGYFVKGSGKISLGNTQVYSLK